MATQELLITRKRSLAGLVMDATVEERFSSKVTVTQNPVEFNAQINDHRIALPDKYTLSGRVSNTPITNIVPDPWINGDAETRSKSAWAVLRDLQKNGEPFTIESGLQRYDNMVIENLDSNQNASTNNVLDFVAQCTQVIIVDTQEIAIGSPEEGATEEQASTEVDRGDVQTEFVTEEQEQSWLLQLLEVTGVSNGETNSN